MEIKKKIFLLFAFLTLSSYSQTAPTKFWIQFTDKNNSPYSVSTPSQFLSQRAIDRRTKFTIAIQQNDIPINKTYTDSIQKSGLTILNKSKWFNAATIYTSDTNLLTQIRSYSFVKKIEPVRKMKRKKNFSVDENISDTEKQNLLIQETTKTTTIDYGFGANQAQMIGADCLHNLGYQGQGMLIAVLDAGFYNVDILPAFDSLWANNQILGTRDFVQGDASVFEDDAHGMMVLSTIGGNIPGQLVGTAPKANFWLIRTEDAPSEYVVEEDNWVAGAEFADSVGADVFNTSLGYTTFDDPSQDHTYADMDGNTTRITIASDIASSKGILPVSSAGNEGSSSWFYISAPADADSNLTVGAVDASGNIASFSSRGPTFDGRIKPNVVAQGSPSAISSTSGTITFGSGTSFSSPITCGAVACLWQSVPTKTNMELINAIQQSASQFSTPDNDKGYGIPNFCQALTILTGIEEKSYTEQDLVEVFPNPFEDKLNFSFFSKSNSDCAIEIFDLRGRKLYSKNFTARKNQLHNFTLSDVGDIEAGIYILSIKSGGKQYNSKIVKVDK